MGRKGPTLGLLDPLYVEALALKAGQTTVFIITCDLLFTPRNIINQVKDQVTTATGCPRDNFMFCATHCHSSVSPRRGRQLTEEFKKAGQEHQAKIEKGFIKACLDAHASLQPAEAAWGMAKVKGTLGKCRRLRFSNGLCTENWGPGPVYLPGVKFAGYPAPHSTTIPFFSLRVPGQKDPFAVLTSYDAHVHLIPLQYYSAEAPGGIKQRLEKYFPGAIHLYANGAGGDRDLRSDQPPPASEKVPEQVDWYQKSIARMAKKFCSGLVPAIRAARYYRPENLGYLTNINQPDRLRRMLLKALRIGDCAIINMQGELFGEFGFRLQQQSPFQPLLLLGYNESGYGYVGTPLDYETGSYEIKRIIPRSAEQETEYQQIGLRTSTDHHTLGDKLTEQALALLKGL
jgi:hypothetical protein